MTRIALTAAMMLFALPALANYGDVDAQIESIQLTAVYVAQPQLQPTTDVAATGTCTLPFTHIVSVPEQFEVDTAVEVACLDN